MAIAGSRSAGEVLICILLLVFATSVRAAAWCEYVEANERGIRWRALFRSTSVFWEDIARVEEVRIWRWGRRTQYRPIGLQVVLSDGRTRPLRASIWCGSKARQEWLAAGAAHLGSGRAVAFAPRPD